MSLQDDLMEGEWKVSCFHFRQNAADRLGEYSEEIDLIPAHLVSGKKKRTRSSVGTFFTDGAPPRHSKVSRRYEFVF